VTADEEAAILRAQEVDGPLAEALRALSVAFNEASAEGEEEIAPEVAALLSDFLGRPVLVDELAWTILTSRTELRGRFAFCAWPAGVSRRERRLDEIEGWTRSLYPLIRRTS
jgi:hypothetical protein